MEVLENGARLLLVPTGRPKTGREPASVELWVMGGASAERPEEHGCAHLLEHMVFKPAETGRGPTDLATRIEALGGDVNAFTSHDETVFHATVPAGRLGSAVDALAGSVLAPDLAADELREEAQVVVEEIRQYRDDPAQRLFQDVVQRLFPEHSYGRPVLGSESEVLSHDARRLARFHRRVYAGRQLLLVVVGPMDRAAVRRRAKRWLGAVPRGRTPRAVKPAVVRGSVRVRTGDVQEAQIVLAWQGAPSLERDGVALEVASVILGHGDASRLVRRVRRRDALVSDIQASWYASREAGTLVVSAHTRPEQVGEAVEAIVDQVRNVRAAHVEPGELSRARAVLESDRIYGRETVSGRAHGLGFVASLCGDPYGEDIYYDHLRALGPADLREVCARELEPARCSVGVVVPRTMPTAERANLRKRLGRAMKPAPRGKARARKAAGDGIVRLDLPSGLRVRIVRDASVAMAAGWLVWPGGQRVEKASRSGIGTLTARLLTRGTSTRSGHQIAEDVDGRAAVLGGFAGRNSLGLHFECLAHDLAFVLGCAAECATDAVFPDDELEEERRVLLQEIPAEDDDPGQVAFREMARSLFGRHPLGRPRRGSPETLARLDGAALRGEWRRRYPLRGAVLGLCGDVDPSVVEAVLAAVDPGGPVRDPVERRIPRWPRRPRRTFVQRDREQCHVAMGHPGVELGDPAGPAVDVLMSLLGGQSGRLFVALREREGLVYHVSASSTEAVDAGHAVLYAATSADKLDRTLAAIDREVDRVCVELARPAELERARTWLIGQFEASLQRRSRVASHLAFDDAYGLGVGRYLTYVDRVGAVSAEDVREVARRVLDPRHRATAIVGPRGQS